MIDICNFQESYSGQLRQGVAYNIMDSVLYEMSNIYCKCSLPLDFKLYCAAVVLNNLVAVLQSLHPGFMLQ